MWSKVQTTHLESVPQCMAYILARCPRSVRRVRICIRPTGSTFAAACVNEMSAAAFLASYKCHTGNLLHTFEPARAIYT